MRPTSTRHLLGLLVPALAVAAAVLLAPTTVGGSATWVTTYGDSMEPGITAGDLVVARSQADYQVGDVVAYPSEQLDGTVVLHRIVADEPDGFVTQGDNNDWLDPDQPQAAEILGAMWLHIPGGGRVLSVLADPFVIAALVLTVLTAGAFFTTKRSRRGSRRAAGAASSRPQVPSDWPVGQWAAGAAVAAVAMGLLSFSRPVETTTTEPLDVSHVADLSYSAPADAPDLYEGGDVRTGDPVFLSVAPVLDAGLDYRLEGADGATDVSGTITTTAEVAAGNGWSRTVPLGEPVEFSGPTAEHSAKVDLPQLLKVVERAEEQAGTQFGGRTVTVVHEIHVAGEVEGQPVDTTYRPSQAFAVDAVQAVPQGSEGLDREAGAVTVTEAESITISGTTAATVTLLRWDVPVSVLRVVTLVLAAAALALGALAFWRQAEQPRHAVFGKRLVPVSHLELGDRPVVDVDDPRALLHLATMYDTVVLRLSRDDQDLLVVVADGTAYRYAEIVPLPDGRTGRRLAGPGHGPTRGQSR